MINWRSLTDYETAGAPTPEDGLRPQGFRGRLGQSWWSQRLLEPCEQTLARQALDLGRRYARKGQILSLDIAPGVITGAVQGAREEPYHCRIEGTAFTRAQWDNLVERLVSTSVYFAGLLAGMLPRSLVAVCHELDLELFPESAERMALSCDCDEEVCPCKHVAALLYLFADRLDANPFLLLQWRGMGENELLGALRKSWGASTDLEEEQEHHEPGLKDLDLTRFYDLAPDFDDLVCPPPESYPDVIKRLGFPPFFPPGDRNVQQVLENLYDQT